MEKWRCEIYAYKNPTKLNALECHNETVTLSATIKTTTDKIYPWSHDYLNNIPTQKTLHYTFIFQMFVFMQVFNQINARKLFEGEINVFSGIFRNSAFLIIVLLTIVVQVVMVQIGGKAVKTFPLDIEQNIICLCVGAGELLWGLILKFIPSRFFGCLSINDQPLPEGEEIKGPSTLMKQSTLRK